MRWLDGITDSTDVNLDMLQSMGVAESDRTEHSVQETKTGYLLFLLLPFLKGKQGADFKCLDWNPPTSCLWKCKQEASCKRLTWSPFNFDLN